KIWVIPSHENYPADANTQLADAAGALVNKERGSAISSSKGLHGQFGVRNPNDEIKSGDRGVGTLVTFADENGKRIAELIVGKEVKDRSGHRYVRLPDNDAVYQVKVDAEKFSTKFKDWIEPKLLKLDSFKIKNLTIIDTGLKEIAPGEAAPETRGVMEFTYDDVATGDHWKLLDAAPGAKLDETKLNDLRSALDDMKIVDVH